MTDFYKAGAREALRRLRLLKESADDRYGTPYPEKSPTINAEALASLLQKEDDHPGLVNPENGTRRDLGTPVTWGQSSHIDENQPNSGMMLPGNPRS